MKKILYALCGALILTSGTQVTASFEDIDPEDVKTLRYASKKPRNNACLFTKTNGPRECSLTPRGLSEFMRGNLASMRNLRALSVFLGETPDESFVNLNEIISPQPSFQKLHTLQVFNVPLREGIPDSIGFLTNLTNLFIESKNYEGPLPKAIWNLVKLDTLILRCNFAQDVLSDEIGALTDLTELDLKNCNLSGKIPEKISQLTMLTSLTLNDNNFEGEIPSGITKLKFLIELNFANNNLTGEIPHELGSQLEELAFLNLEGNLLYGPIPNSMSELKSLRCLQLKDNNFSSGLEHLSFKSKLNTGEGLCDISGNYFPQEEADALEFQGVTVTSQEQKFPNIAKSARNKAPQK